jgi:type I restriction enzyme S subunit
MKSKFKIQKLGELITEVSIRNNRKIVSEVFSVTNSEGFIKSTDYFEKEVFSKNTSNYKIVKPNQFAYNPSRINVGSIDFLRNDFDVAISPLYVVFQCKENLLPDYLLRYLKSPIGNSQIRSKTRGAVRDNLTYSSLSEINIPITDLAEQRKIIKLLGTVEGILAKRKKSIELLDDLLKSKFYKMFGDPTKNEKNWTKTELKQFGQIITGNTPPRNNSENYSTKYVEWIKTDNIPLDETYITNAHEYLSEAGLKTARTIDSGALLVACIAGSIDSIGRVALTDKKVSFNQQINAIQPNDTISPLFLYWLFKSSKKYIQSYASKGMKKVLTKGVFEKIKMIRPPIEIQNEFVSSVEKVEFIKRQFKESLKYLETFQSSLSSLAFRGELDLSKLVSDEYISDNIDISYNAQNATSIVKNANVKKSSGQESILRVITNKYFEKGFFSYEDLAEKIQAEFIDEDYDYKNIKEQVFNSIRGDGDIKLKQIFSEKDKKVLLYYKK